MVQCKFRVKIISVIYVLACQQLLPREEGVGGVGLLPFLLPTLSRTENPCIKIKAVFVKRGLPIHAALSCKEFTFYLREPCYVQAKCQKQFSTPQTSFTSSFLSVPLFPLHIDQMKWSPYQFYSENL